MTESQFTRPRGHKQSPSPNWVCDVCRDLTKPGHGFIKPGHGFIGVKYADIRTLGNGGTIRWRALHGDCADDNDEDGGISDTYYAIPVTQVQTLDAVKATEHHLNSKRWFEFSDWPEFVARIGLFGHAA